MAVEPFKLDVGGLTVSGLRAGPPDGPLVVLLHGFPEFSGAWRRQLDSLASAGFHVVAPDGRGYGGSDKPAGVAAFALDHLAGDVVALAARLGSPRFCAVGHDWGGIVAWHLAATYPACVDRLVVLNAPHPAAVQPFMRRHPGQVRRSWYVAFFQLPGLPERLMRRNGFFLLRRAMTQSSRPGTFGAGILRDYAAAWAQPGALTSMVNWYRALIRFPPRRAATEISCPCRVLWGVNDRFLDRRLAQASLAFCSHGEIVWFDQATHWLHHEEPEAVSDAIVDFLEPDRTA